tara:strand:- start:52 stop:675 length:624 start_codon:yes stop_codon:yes gene_type:complete
LEKIETPFGIHAEFVSDRAVQNCINMYKKDGHRVQPGMSGPHRQVIKKVKDSLDLGLGVDEIDRLKIWHKEMHNVIDNYIRKFPILSRHHPWGYVDGINIQYYKAGGGYKKEHSEVMDNQSSHRIMAFMTYLTDTKNAGTEFTYLNWTAPCKKGLTLIWPVNYPYAHRGVISEKEDKMIITGWLGFDTKHRDTKEDIEAMYSGLKED